MKLRQSDEECLVVRTDYENEPAWLRLVDVLTHENADGFLADVQLVEDPQLSGIDVDGVRALLHKKYDHPLLAIVDSHTVNDPDMPILVIDLDEQPGRSIRVVASQLWSIENNLALANMEFDDFTQAAGVDGVFRGVV